MTKQTASILTTAALLLTLTACGGSGTTTSASSSSASSSASTTPSVSPSATASSTTDETKPHHHAPIVMTKSTVAPAEKGGKTYVLGTLKNTGTQAITIKSATSDYAESVELHKTVNGVMSVDTAGWTLKPGESLELTDSGFHIAVKGLKASMKTGDAIEVHLNTTDGPAHLELTIGNATGSSHSH